MYTNKAQNSAKIEFWKLWESLGKARYRAISYRLVYGSLLDFLGKVKSSVEAGVVARYPKAIFCQQLKQGMWSIDILLKSVQVDMRIFNLQAVRIRVVI